MASSRAMLTVAALLAGCTGSPSPTFGSGGQGITPEWGPLDWYHDYFTPTFQLCGEPTIYRPYEPMYIGDGESPAVDHVYYVSDECLDAIAADMKLDESSFPYDYYVDEYGDEALAQQVMESTILRARLGGYALLSLTQATTDELDLLTDELDIFYVRPEIVEHWQELGERMGEDRLRALAYNTVMSSLLEIRFANRDEVTWRGLVHTDTRTAQLTFEDGGVMNSIVLLHEAMHVWLDVGHVDCPEDSLWVSGTTCDETWYGTWGFGAAAAQLQRDAYPWQEEPEFSEYMDQTIGAFLALTEDAILEECCPELLEEDSGSPYPAPPPRCGSTHGGSLSD